MLINLIKQFTYMHKNMFVAFNNKQLLTFVEVDMLFCRPRKSDIDRDEVEVNITFQGSAKQHIDRNKS